MEFITKFFKLQENKTTVRTEIIAGITTFMTMAYILFLNPNILSATGMDKNAIFFATAIAAGFVTIAMGLVANFPICIGSGYGFECFFCHCCFSRGRNAMACCSGRGVHFRFDLYSFKPLRKFARSWLLQFLMSLKVAITVGIGLFITIIGLKLSEIMAVSANVIPPTLEHLNATKGQSNLLFFEWNIGLGSLKIRPCCFA